LSIRTAAQSVGFIEKINDNSFRRIDVVSRNSAIPCGLQKALMCFRQPE
jgi:hypothetical protein